MSQKQPEIDGNVVLFEEDLWQNERTAHKDQLLEDGEVDTAQLEKVRLTTEANRAQAVSLPKATKRLFGSGLQALNTEEVDKLRKRAATGDGISAGSASPPLTTASKSPPPRHWPASALYGSGSASDPSKRLWNPDQDSTGSQGKTGRNFSLQSQHVNKQSSPATQTTVPSAICSSKQAAVGQSQAAPLPTKQEQYNIMLEPETRPISQEQLVAEVKGIYAGLVMVEAKCIEVDNKQAAIAQTEGAQSKLNNEQWQALIALHRTLLHEHHDFFLASQHPSASPALRRLASKYAMPARMWRHGIHSFLELLRHRLPASLDHMLAFIYLAYSMMALLYETVPAFEDTWIECLGDLGRYRMAIEDDDIKDREVWTGVARHWYSKASDKAPTTGRLYHHLAILARPNALQQLFYYSKALCVIVPFTSARESILTLFEPVLSADNNQYRLPPLDTAFVKAHGLLFTNRDIERFDPAAEEFLKLLDNQIGRVTRKFMEQGYHIAVANIVSMLGWVSKDNPIIQAMAPASNNAEEVDLQMEGMLEALSPAQLAFEKAERLHNETTKIILQRIGDPNVLPYIHVLLVFMCRMSRHPTAIEILEVKFPWELLVTVLNTLLASYGMPSRIEEDKFPLPEKDDARPFPEDFAIRSLLWTDDYFPTEWFNSKIDEEEKYHERASMTEQRKERILFLACQFAKSRDRIQYHSNIRRFSLPAVQDSEKQCVQSTSGVERTWDSEATQDSEREKVQSSTMSEGNSMSE